MALLAAVPGATMAGLRDDLSDAGVPRAVPAATRFYADPENPSAAWARAHPDDPRARPIGARIAGEPQATWFVTVDPYAIEGQVRALVGPAARRGEVPVFVVYALPHRDCWGPSAGGASTVREYREWVDRVARGLGRSDAWVVLEPDALAQAGCLGHRQRAARFRALAYAARTLRRAGPGVRVYYDAGHSGWHDVSTMADRLRRAGALRYADGVSLNVANVNPTGSEVRYGVALLAELGTRRLRIVVDTSRNGAGGPAEGTVCDPAGRALGRRPTAHTGNAWVDALLWIKPPGHSDGCADVPGAYLPGHAVQLATRPREGGRSR